MDYNLVCANGRWFGDEGAFKAVAVHQYTYVFAVGSQGSCYLRMYQVAPTKTNWVTASINR
ncbi:MAG: hypothetical protein FWF75_05205 [Propionibacteriaceae bacterium]|nr:hypothetical protein [Propionibacteriaceae bacterium]